MAKSKAQKPDLDAATEPAAPAVPAVNMRGLKCPLPVLKTRKLLMKLAPGEVLVIECTDPLTTIDIPNLLRETGDALEGSTKQGRVLSFRIRKT
jgi:tRNA 2-thiouridine synthesizing protein A